MTTPAAWISEAEWLASPASVRTLIQAQQAEIRQLHEANEQLHQQLTSLATELASLRERIGRNSRNSSKPPSSDSPGHRCEEDALRATSRPPAAEAVVAGEVVSRAIPGLVLSCCRSSASTR